MWSMKTTCTDVPPSGAERLQRWNGGERKRLATRAPTHRAEAHGTGMVTHSYGSADGATYQTGGARFRLQEAVGLRRMRLARDAFGGGRKDALADSPGLVQIRRIWGSA